MYTYAKDDRSRANTYHQEKCIPYYRRKKKRSGGGGGGVSRQAQAPRTRRGAAILYGRPKEKSPRKMRERVCGSCGAPGGVSGCFIYSGSGGRGATGVQEPTGVGSWGKRKVNCNTSMSRFDPFRFRAEFLVVWVLISRYRRRG